MFVLSHGLRHGYVCAAPRATKDGPGPPRTVGKRSSIFTHHAFRITLPPCPISAQLRRLIRDIPEFSPTRHFSSRPSRPLLADPPAWRWRSKLLAIRFRGRYIDLVVGARAAGLSSHRRRPAACRRSFVIGRSPASLPHKKSRNL